MEPVKPLLPYISATGFSRGLQIRELMLFPRLCRTPHCHRFAAGVLVADKMLDDQENPIRPRHVNQDQLIDVVNGHRHHDEVSMVLHYSGWGRFERRLEERLRLLVEMACPSRMDRIRLGGIQLNGDLWPDKYQLKAFTQRWYDENGHPLMIILPITRGRLSKTLDMDMASFVGKVRRDYSDTVTHLLYDLSAGRGEPLSRDDLTHVRELYAAMRTADLSHVRVGLSGGLSCETLPEHADFLTAHPDISLDGESAFFTRPAPEADEEFNVETVRAYTRLANRLLGRED